MDKNSTIRDIKLSKEEELKYIKPLMYKLWEATRGALKYFDNDDNDSPFYVTVGVLVNNLAYAKSVGEANDIVDCIESLCLHLGRDHHLTWSVYLTVKESIDLAVDELDY